MAITLRYTATDTGGKTSELTYQEMNDNLKSYYYSSSLAGNTLSLHTAGTDTHSIDLPSAGTVDTGSFYYSSSVSLNTITFYQGDGTTESLTVDTGSGGGGSTSPGGSDTYVQFNDGGSTFGGDSGLTYNKTANKLTITAPSSPTRTSPNLLLNSELSDVTAGEVLGVIAANNATDQYSPANYPASIQFVADANFAPGIYDTSIRLYTNDGATEKEALRLINTGQNRLPQYGTGTFTGTAAKWLAVDSSGNVIEETAPVSGTPGGSDTYVQFNDGGSLGGDAGMTYNKSTDALTVAGNISGSDIIAGDDLYAKGMNAYTQPSVGYLQPVVIDTSDGLLWRSVQQPLVGNIEVARITGIFTLNAASNPLMNEVNGGRILCFPTASNCTLKVGFAAGDEGSTSWEKDFRTTIYNLGCDTTDTTDQNYDMQLQIVMPNDGGGSFKSYFIGENSVGTAQFEYDSTSPNNGVTFGTTIKAQAMVDIMMDYENRTIVVWGKSVT